MSEHIVWHQASVSAVERTAQKGHKPCILWYTGLSGAGKSTVANAVDRLLFLAGCHSYVLDGDNVRHGLNKDLAFDDESRIENIRRVTEVANLFTDAGLIVSTAFISPFRADRKYARLHANAEFIEVFVDAPLAVCEQRDPKGLYNKARRGEIEHFTGITSSYEVPDEADVHLTTADMNIEQAAEKVLKFLHNKGLVNPL